MKTRTMKTHWYWFCMGSALTALLGWNLQLSGCASGSDTVSATIPVIRTSTSSEQFYGGYQQIQCLSCDKVAELENGRAPLAFIIGVQKGGTTRLLSNLRNHPRISYQERELHVFDFYWDEYGTNSTAHRCPVMEFYNDLLSQTPNPQQDVILDKSPSYLWNSYIVPQRILCVFPNTKLIVILRNPIDRAFSHYRMQRDRRKRKGLPMDPFATIVDQNIAQLESFGLLNPNLTPQQEYEIWSQKPEMKDNMVGRGFYAIQLRQVMSVLGDHFGWDQLSKQLLVLESEQVWKDEDGHLQKVLDFLHLSSFVPPAEEEKQHKKGISKTHNSLDETIRKRLEDLYRPHNQKLRELLAPLGIEISWPQ